MNKIKILLRVIDIIITPLLVPISIFMVWVRRYIFYLPLSRKTLLNIGVFPIRNHYYEPLIDFSELKKPLEAERNLPGIQWDSEKQLKYLDNLTYGQELLSSQNDLKITDDLIFYFNNGSFETADAEYWYQIIRYIKPRTIIEIGSGNSTLVALKALIRNTEENTSYKCNHICIEPYEQPWLEKTGATVIRKKLEDINTDIFQELEENDILFIDSSHIIRPQGDVLYEYLELLPTLKKGVIVHIHDIFTPQDYPSVWIKDRVWFWNEQYLLEAFLSSNKEWKIIGALNWIHHNHYEKLKQVCTTVTPKDDPGSFYIQKII